MTGDDETWPERVVLMQPKQMPDGSWTRLRVSLETCDGTYVDFQGANRSCLSGGEGCGLYGCRAAHGPSGGW